MEYDRSPTGDESYWWANDDPGEIDLKGIPLIDQKTWLYARPAE